MYLAPYSGKISLRGVEVYIKKMVANVLPYEILSDIAKGKLDYFNPTTVQSSNWKHWVAQMDEKMCATCESKHGEIYSMNETPPEEPPIHFGCRCKIEIMRAVFAGNATKDGQNGADYWIKHYGALPDYYISEDDLLDLGWNYGKAPSKFAPGKMATMGEYRNDDGHLPQIVGRSWYEADINYYSGKRNKHRLLWSNDGLIFVTYDHYETFIELI